jgi:hypothetical protein
MPGGVPGLELPADHLVRVVPSPRAPRTFGTASETALVIAAPSSIP